MALENQRKILINFRFQQIVHIGFINNQPKIAVYRDSQIFIENPLISTYIHGMDGNISTNVGLTHMSVSINIKYIVTIFILFLILDYSYELFEIINMRLLLHFQKIGCTLVFKI